MSERRRLKSTLLVSAEAMAFSSVHIVGLAISELLADVEKTSLALEWGTLNITGVWTNDIDDLPLLTVTLSMEGTTTPESDDAEVQDILRTANRQEPE